MSFLKIPISILAAIIFLLNQPLSAQTSRLPRDSDKLIFRAQSFWSFMLRGQKLKALDFVLPEKKDTFLSQNFMPIVAAKVVGLDLTDDPVKATVHVQLSAMTPESIGNSAWVVKDTWVWQRGTWYLSLADHLESLRGSSGTSPDVTTMVKDIRDNLRFPVATQNAGKIVQGRSVRFEFPIEYQGKQPLFVEMIAGHESVSLAVPGGQVTAESKHVTLSLDSTGWEGPITLPIRLRFRHEAASVEQVLTIQATIFAPVTFRQVPEKSADPSGRISVFIRNNTSERIIVRAMSVDSKLDVLKGINLIEPDSETEVVFKLRPGETPENMSLTPDHPVEGIGAFMYHFRIAP